MNSKFGFWLRRTATEFEPASIAQLIQVELLPHRLRLAQIQGVFLPNSQISSSFRYKMRIIISVCLIFLSCAIHAIEKVNYQVHDGPHRCRHPLRSKDQVTLNLCIDGIRKQCQQVRRIIVVSQKRLTENAEWFDESLFPFQQRDIALAMFRGDAEAASRYINMGNRLGWILQQLLKLYALHTIPGISPNVLVLDADTIFLNPVSFLDSRGVPIFTAAREYYEPYFAHMRHFAPLG